MKNTRIDPQKQARPKKQILNIKVTKVVPSKVSSTYESTVFSTPDRTFNKTNSVSFIRTDPILQANVRPKEIFQSKNHKYRKSDSFTLSYCESFGNIKPYTNKYNSHSDVYSGSIKTYPYANGTSLNNFDEPNIQHKKAVKRNLDSVYNIAERKPLEVKFNIRIKSAEKDFEYGKPSNDLKLFNNKVNPNREDRTPSRQKKDAIKNIFKSSFTFDNSKENVRSANLTPLKKPYKPVNTEEYSFNTKKDTIKDLVSYKDGPKYKDFKLSNKVNVVIPDIIRKVVMKSRINDLQKSFHK